MTIKTQLQIVDNVFVKMYHLSEIGDEITGHTHIFDHITLLSRGSVMMKAKGVEVAHTSPKLLVTTKGVVHRFVALERGCVLCCIHAIRNGDNLDDIAPQEITEAEAQHLVTSYPVAV